MDIYSIDLKALRKKKRFSQVQFSELLGITQAYYSELERGGRPISDLIANRIQELIDERPPQHHGATLTNIGRKGNS